MKQSFVRVDINGVMIYWMAMTDTVKKSILGHVASRLNSSLSSNVGRAKRLEINPKAIDNIRKALDILSRSPASVKVSVFEYVSKDKVSTRILNEQELWISAGKEVPIFTPETKASHLFRLEALEALSKVSK